VRWLVPARNSTKEAAMPEAIKALVCALSLEPSAQVVERLPAGYQIHETRDNQEREFLMGSLVICPSGQIIRFESDFGNFTQ